MNGRTIRSSFIHPSTPPERFSFLAATVALRCESLWAYATVEIGSLAYNFNLLYQSLLVLAYDSLTVRSYESKTDVPARRLGNEPRLPNKRGRYQAWSRESLKGVRVKRRTGRSGEIIVSCNRRKE